MPTTVTKTIGSSISPLRDYATHALWIAACPSNLVTADQIWAGQSFNDSGFSFSVGLSISGITTDSTRYVDLDVGTGQGFNSAASPVGAALQSKGVYLNCTGYAQTSITVTIATFKLHNHQIVQTGGGNRAALLYNSGGSTDSLVENCIFESPEKGVTVRYGRIRNSLSVNRGNNSNAGWDFDYSQVVGVANCGAVRPSNFTPAGTAFGGGNTPLKNCYSFGFTTFSASGFTGSNNASDLASIPFGTSNQTSVPFTTSTFVVATDTSHDYRLVSGAAKLLDQGVTDTTDIPAAVDAWGTSRPQGSAWDIGFHELASGGGGVSVALTGIGGTGALGTLGKSVSHALTGVSGTGALGIFGKSVVHALTGVSGTAFLGTLTPTTGKAVALTGISGTGSLGTLSAKTSHALTGVSGTGSLGTLTPSKNKNVALTGVSGTGSLGTLGKSVSHRLTGIQATGFLGTLVPSTSGPVTLALTGIQGRGFLGSLGLIAPAAVGGHFLPLTEKQLRELKKRERKDRQHRDDLDDSRKMDAVAIEADIRSHMFPSAETIINEEIDVETVLDDDEEDDLAFILMHA